MFVKSSRVVLAILDIWNTALANWNTREARKRVLARTPGLFFNTLGSEKFAGAGGLAYNSALVASGKELETASPRSFQEVKVYADISVQV